MMRAKLRSACLALVMATLPAACAYPVSSVVQGGEESALYFESFPPDAAVFVDNQFAGTAGQFDGAKQSLAVPTGTHTVQVRLGETVLVEKKVYVGRNSALKITP